MFYNQCWEKMKQWLNSFKESGFVKGLVYAVIGICSYPGLNIINRLEVKGMDILHKLPKKNVLFSYPQYPQIFLKMWENVLRFVNRSCLS